MGESVRWSSVLKWERWAGVGNTGESETMGRGHTKMQFLDDADPGGLVAAVGRLARGGEDAGGAGHVDEGARLAVESLGEVLGHEVGAFHVDNLWDGSASVRSLSTRR